jgi:hypothetical protein
MTMATTNYYAVQGELLGEKVGAGSRADYLTDALGSVTATVDHTGTMLNRYAYKPYGTQLSKSGAAARRRRVVLASTCLLGLAIGYFGAALIVFDFTSPALSFDEEFFGNRRVAIGPVPRLIFCTPDYGTFQGSLYSGEEWPFRFFAPVCGWWRSAYGYAAPKAIRREQ